MATPFCRRSATRCAARRAAVARRRRRALPAPQPAGGRRAGQRGARAPARRPHLLQPQPAHQRHQRLRGELHVLLVRAPARRASPAPTRCRTRRPGRSCARASRPTIPSPRSTSSTACTPGLPFDYYTELLAGLKRIQPRIHLKAFTAVEIDYFAKKYGHADRGGAHGAARGRPRFAARRRRRDLRAARAQEDLRRQVHRRRVAGGAPHRPPAWACARTAPCSTAHIETVEERVDHMLRLRALQDETGGFQTLHPAGLPPRQQRADEAAGADGRRGPAHLRGRAAAARTTSRTSRPTGSCWA